MARYEMTLANGEKILVDHAGGCIRDVLAELDGKAFLLLGEVNGGSFSPARDVIVASAQVVLIRQIGDAGAGGAAAGGKP